MRKQLKLLLLVATVVALFAMAMIVGSAATIEVGTVDELKAAIGDCTADPAVVGTAQEGDTVKLTTSLTLPDGVKINLDKAITIDGDAGNGNKYAIHFKSTTGFLIQFYASGATVKNVTVTSDMTSSGSSGIANGLFAVAAGTTGTFTIDGVNAEIAGCIMRHLAAKTTKTDGYTLVVKNSTLKTTETTARGFVFGQHAAATGAETPRQSATFTNCVLEFVGTSTNDICFEGALVTFDGCTITAASTGTGKGLFYVQSLSTDFIFKGKTTISCKNFANVTKGGKIIFGEENKTNEITLNIDGYMTRNTNTSLDKIAFYGATVNCTNGYLVGYLTGVTELIAKDATFNMKNGGAIIQEYKATGACAATFEGCTIISGADAEYVQHGLYWNNQTTERKCTINYKNCTIIVAAPLATVTTEGEGEEAVTTVTPFTLFEDAVMDKLGDGIVLAVPADTTVKASLTINRYAQTVKYATKELKLWYELGGHFITTPEASIYVDTANVATSGLRFNTELSVWDVETLTGVSFDMLLEESGDQTLKFYTLVAPLDYVFKAGAFTKEALDSKITLTPEEQAAGKKKYVAIQANNTLNRDTYASDEVITYSGALIELKSYERVYAAIAMIEVWSGDTLDATYYANFSTNVNGRTAQQIAKAVQESAEYAEMVPAQKAIVDAYAAGDPDAEQ